MADKTVSILAVLQDQLSGPLNKIVGGVDKLQSGFSKVGSALSPLTSGFAQLAVAIGATATASKALDAAQAETQAQQRLLTALKGRTEEHKKILKLTSEIQDQTEFADEDLDNAAASLVNMGVAAEDIPKTLQAAVDTASAFGLELDTVVKGIGQFNEGGAGSLGRVIPQLKELAAEGRLAGEGIEFLTSQFGGSAAKQAQTTFGQITVEGNRAGDALEKIGNVLAELKLSALKALTPVINSIADAMSSPTFTVFVKSFKELAPLISVVAGALGALFLGGLAVKVGAFLAPVISGLGSILAGLATIGAAIATFLISPIGLVTAGIVALVAVLGQMLGVWESIGEVISEFVDYIGEIVEGAKEIVGEIAAGQLTIGDLFDYLKTRAKEAFIVLDAFLFNPVFRVLKAVFDTVRGLIGVISFAVLGAVADIINGIQKGIKFVLNKIAEGLQGVLNFFNDALLTIDEQIGTSLGKKGGFTFANDLEDKLFDMDFVADGLAMSLAESENLLLESFPEAIADIQQQMDLANDLVGKEREALEARLQASRERQIQAKKDQIAKEIELEKQKNARLLAEQAIYEQQLSKQSTLGKVAAQTQGFFNLAGPQIADLIKNVDLASIDSVKALILKDLDNQLKNERITVEKFLELKRQTETGFFARQAEETDKQIAKEREKLDLLKQQQNPNAKTLEDLQKQTSINGAIVETEQKLLDLSKKRNELTATEIGQQQSLRDTRLQLAGFLSAKVSENLDTFKTDVQPLLDGIANGTVAIADGFAQINTEALASEAAIADLQARIQALLIETEDPKLADDLAIVNRELDKLLVKSAADISNAIAEAIKGGFDQAASELADVQSRIAFQLQNGLISQGEATERTNAALEEFRARADEATEALARLGEQSPQTAGQVAVLTGEITKATDQTDQLGELNNTDLFGGIVSGIGQAAEAYGNLAAAGKELGSTLIDGLAQGLIDVFVAGRKSFGDFAKQFLTQISEMILKALILKAISAAIGVPLNSGGEVTSDGGVKRYSIGGAVSGPHMNRDTVPAMLTPHEYVMDTTTTGFYGMEAMRAIHSRRIPRDVLRSYSGSGSFVVGNGGRYASGGDVSGLPAPSGVKQGFILASDTEMDKFLAGGTGAFERHLRDNRARFKTALGIA